MKPESAISCELKAGSLRVAYGETLAVDIPDLRASGNVIAVVGHNGAGKSTLIKTALGLLQPDEGTLSAQFKRGDEIIDLRPERHMAFCPENGAVFADITVEEYVRLWCRIKRRDSRYYRKGGAKFVEMLHIAPLLKKLGRELSKGQRRRVQLAIGLLIGPKLFLVDEPFCGLDVQKTNELGNVIYEASRETAFIIASHRMEVVERLVDCVVVLKQGRIEASGSVCHVAERLCGQTAVISNVSDRERMMLSLKHAYPSALVIRRGDDITVSGHDYTFESLTRLVAETDGNGACVCNAPPCLVDALNYHLQNLEAANSVW